MNTVRHVFLSEFVIQLIHQGLNHTRGISTRNVAVQPALGVRDHGDRVTGTTYRVTSIFKGIDQWLYFGFVSHGHFHIGTDSETDVAISVLVDDVTQQVDFVWP